MSSASRGVPPREGLECMLVKMGRTGPLAEPRRGSASRSVRAIFIDKAFKTLLRGQASRGGQSKTSSSGAASLGRLTRGGEIKAR